MPLQELSINAKQQQKQITSLPFLDSFTGFPSRNGSAPKFSLPLTGQFMITPPSTSLIFSKNTTLLAFSDQHLDLSLMFPGPGIPRQSGTASEPSDMSLLPLECPLREHQGEGLHSVFQTFAENPFLYLGMIVSATVYVRFR